MYEIRTSERFDRWLAQLEDPIGRATIYSRLDRASRGSWGDVAPIGEGVWEMRIHAGPGYRIYYKRVDNRIYVILSGGDKSTQIRDIRAALIIAKGM